MKQFLLAFLICSLISCNNGNDEPPTEGNGKVYTHEDTLRYLDSLQHIHDSLRKDSGSVGIPEHSEIK